MNLDTDNKATKEEELRSPYDPDPISEDDLWFLPPPSEATLADMPWPVAARELDNTPAAWQAGEAAQYRGLLQAAQMLARFSERLQWFEDGVGERFALSSVTAVLRAEGVWLSPVRIALYRALRIGTDDTDRDLARAGWAMRRLKAAGRFGGPLEGVHGFLGRNVAPVSQPGHRFFTDDRPLGLELEALGDRWIGAVRG